MKICNLAFDWKRECSPCLYCSYYPCSTQDFYRGLPCGILPWCQLQVLVGGLGLVSCPSRLGCLLQRRLLRRSGRNRSLSCCWHECFLLLRLPRHPVGLPRLPRLEFLSNMPPGRGPLWTTTTRPSNLYLILLIDGWRFSRSGPRPCCFHGLCPGATAHGWALCACQGGCWPRYGLLKVTKVLDGVSCLWSGGTCYVLARAFLKDPGSMWSVSHEVVLSEVHWWMCTYVQDCLSLALTFCTEGNCLSFFGFEVQGWGFASCMLHCVRFLALRCILARPAPSPFRVCRLHSCRHCLVMLVHGSLFPGLLHAVPQCHSGRFSPPC